MTPRRIRVPRDSMGRPEYDWLSNAGDDDENAPHLRSGRAPSGVLSYGSPGERGRRLWTWGCRCGAWQDGGDVDSRDRAREAYRAHRGKCPLRMGLVWVPERERWEDPPAHSTEEPNDG